MGKKSLQDYAELEQRLAAAEAELRALREGSSEAAAQQAGSAEAQKYRHLVEHSQSIIYTIRADGVITFVSPGWRILLGYETDDVIGESFRKYVHEEDVSACEAYLARLFNSEQVQSGIEYRVRHRDGTYRWHRSILAPVFDAQHRPVEMVGTAVDISAQRTAEQNYAMLFREMLNGLAVHEIICDAEGRPIDYRFLSVNPAFERMTGLRSDMVVGRRVLEVLPETEQHWIETYGRVALTGEPVFFEEHSRVLDKWFEVTAFCPAAGQFACIFADVTARKKFESENRILANIIKKSRDFIGVADAEMHAFYVNPAGQAMIGLDGEEAVRKTSVEDYFFEEDVPFIRQVILPTLKAEGRWAGEFRFRHFKTGEPIHVLYDLFCTEDPETGKVTNVTTISRDITQLKAAEDALRESEMRVRAKLDAILSPEGDISRLPLEDILDIPAIQLLMDEFHRLTHIGIAIIDLNGKVLVGTGWQDICTLFHRVHPESAACCQESDIQLSKGVEPGNFKIYKCKNGMWDMATPIMIGSAHIGNLFLGQFFFEGETVDEAFFKAQAARYGFDEASYLAALRRVPIWSRDTVITVMRFYTLFASLISRLSYANVKLARVLEQQKQTSAALAESEKKYRMLVETATEGIWVIDADHVTTYVNQAMAKMLGCEVHEVLGQKLEAFVPPEDMAIHEKQMRFRHEGKDGKYERRLRRRDGTLLVAMVSAKAFMGEQGRFAGAFAMYSDITERKKAEEALLRREHELQRIFDILPIGLWLTDKQGQVLRRNPMGMKIWGLDPQKPIPASSAFRACRLPSREPVAHGDWALDRTIRTGVTVVDELLEIEALDGRRKTILNYTAPVLDDDGRLEGVVVVNLDVSDRKALEDQLRQSQKMESIGLLAGGVAHDFNNMLSVILGNAELALEQLEPSGSLYGDIQEIVHAAQRSAEVTRQLLAFARKQTIMPQVLGLNAVVGQTLKMLHRLIGEDIDLAWAPAEGLWPVWMDPSQVDQILANLCVNARDAIAGVGRVTIETANVTFDDVSCVGNSGAMQGEFVLLAVSDDGCGMDRETLGKLFEPFFTTKVAGKGTGLGLATVYGVVKQNNGFITVYSEPGQGTTFKIYLPRYTGQEASARGCVEEVAPSGQGETVLLVEDEKGILKLGKTMLEKLGYRVLAVNAPRKALHVAEAHAGKIDLLVTDVVMSEMNGKELAKKLTAQWPEIKVVFMSGYTADVIAHHGVLEDGVSFLQKPFSKETLARKVREALQSGG